MKKKILGNSKNVLIITLVFVVCFIMATSIWAAKKIDFYKSNSKDYIRQLNEIDNREGAAVGPIFGLVQDEELTILSRGTDFNRVTHNRYQQSFKGIPVWGMQTIISITPNNKVVKLHGALVLDTKNDIKNIPGSLDPRGALVSMQKKHMEKDSGAQWYFRNEKYGTYVYLDQKGKAHICYVVSFFADTECGNPSHFIHFIDARNGKVLLSYDMLRYAEGTGPGGNLKVGYYYYGTDYPGFGVSVAGSTCTMNTTDVKTVDLNHGTSGTTAYSYTCYENTHKEINGAYCPLNDAQYFGQVVFDTYNDWYGVAVLPFQLTLRCHYSTNYENAFWDGSTMTFGDGYTTFYPLVSLDVVSHEVSHGFTDYNSDLIYSGQSGGINEAFSDMAGEGAKYYMRGTNDFMVGYDIFKSPSGALRYMYDPPLDGNSIDHVDDYYSGMDVHYSSGVFNKAFYLIATSSGWTTRMAFDIFVKANQDYWQPSTNFQQGGEGALDATLDYGYPCGDVVNAFAQVGIPLTCPSPPVADFIGSPTSGGAPLTVNFTDQSSNSPTSWSWDFGDTGSSTGQNPSHTYTSPGTYTVALTATNSSGSDTETKIDYITVTAPQPPIADFTASSTSISVGDSVTFTDQSLNTPTSWSWTFAGGTPSGSTVQNPTITYNTAGTYTVTLIATNAQGSDTETKVDYIDVAEKPYCTSSGGSQGYEYIAGVIVGDLNNSSGASPYTDYTYLVTHLTQGDTINVSLTPGFPGSSYTEWWKIWIDYNGDHDFEDAGEEVFSGSGSSVVNGNFTVPTSTLLGDTRMRVSMSYSTYPPICGSFTYGEVEDYTANISTAGPQYTLTTNTVGLGSITLDPPGGTYPEDTVVTLTAVPDAGWQFDSWSGDLSGSTNPTTITMNSDKTVTATFTEIIVPQYTLTVNTEGQGSVTLNPPGGIYDEGTVVTLTAIPDAGWQFDNWSDDLSGTQNPTTITMDSDKTVTATFSEVGPTGTVGITDVFGSNSTSAYRRAMPFTMPENGFINSVTMYHTGGSGSMILGVYDGEGTPQNRLGVTATTAVNGSTGWQTIDLTSPAFVAGGTTVWLAWVYESNPGIRYQTGSPGRYQSTQQWTGEMPDPFGSGSQANYLYSIYATYTPGAPPQYTLTTNTVGQGSITLDPPGGIYDHGTVVTLTATPDPGWEFDGWSGDLSGSDNPATITMNANKSVTATFIEIGATGTVGNTTVFGSTSTSAYRRAMPFTMPEDGTITKVTMYHTGGSGSMILGVYAGEGTPQNRLGVTATTAVTGSTGWQTINLTNPAFVAGGTTVWLAWVYESNPGIRYQTGSPGRYQSTQQWTGEMPDPFGSGSQANYLYSIYATYNKN